MEAVWLKKVWITLHATNSKGSRQEWLGSSPGNHYSQDYYYHQQLIFMVEIVALLIKLDPFLTAMSVQRQNAINLLSVKMTQPHAFHQR